MEGYRNYKEVEIETASGLKLVVLMYTGAIKFLNIAQEAIMNKKLDVANNNIIKAQDILAELMASLNFDAGEIANNLYSLYVYMHKRLFEANIQKDRSILSEVLNLMNTLKGAWEELLKNQKSNKSDENSADKRLNISG